MYKGCMPKSHSIKKELPLFNDTPRYMPSMRLRGGRVRSTGKFYIIHNYYDDMFTRKEDWYKDKPCKCGHRESRHYMIIQPRCPACNNCRHYTPMSLKDYTHGMFKNGPFNFLWRFRELRW